MSRAVGNIMYGTGTAAALALMLAIPTIATVATWKVLLAVVGVMLFMFAGRDRASLM
jgi:hypothetical protein